ncbi:MAG: phage tail protein [Pseudomonadota bacterium]
MATLILTAVGTAVGGPIGGALGALAGQAIDAKLLKAKGREGPRLTELAVQTSSYGTPIPQLFGTIRVAGTVIWSTDLIEHAATQGGGKGRGSTTSYSYSASFAVLLSARPIRSVGRIWADGNLLRGAAGDFKTATGFRLYLGHEDQPADPLIASAEAAGVAPACRGQAYAVFEDLALGDFGNRIPSLTFEVEADAAPVTCGAIVEAVSNTAISGGEASAELAGYSAYGETLRGVIEGLNMASGAWFASAGGRLGLRAGSGSAIDLTDAGAGRGKRRTRMTAAADTAPRTVVLQHYDPARDYQTGLQRARRAGAGTRDLRIELPAVLDAGAAKTLAQAALVRADLARERRVLSLDWRGIAVAPGDRVTIAGEAGLWRVADWSLEAMVLTLELVRVARASFDATATPGRVSSAPDAAIGSTVVHAFEMPPIDDAILSVPRLTVAAAGTGPAWRSAGLQLSLDDGARWTAIGSTRGRATLGWLATTVGFAPSTLVDRRHAFDVTLAHPGITLVDADTAALDRGANLAMVGDELLQFGRAEQVGPARWRLSMLWRGRRGTEWAAGRAVTGDRFVLIDPTALAQVDLGAAAIGGSATVMAVGGDGEHASATAGISGCSVAPPAPVHVSAAARVGGALALRWVRRSRSGWHWIDGVDAPLVEESELYALAGGGPRVSITQADADLPPGAWSAGTPVELRQIGTHAWSAATRVMP